MNAIETGNPDRIEGQDGLLTWTATILACSYIVWMGYSLYIGMPTFLNMFSSMGVDLHSPTLLIITLYRWMFPVLFGGAVALVVIKQFFVRQKWASLVFTLGVVVVADIISREITMALYRPMFDMVEKLSK